MYPDFLMIWQDLLVTGLKEDGGAWDWTTLGIQATQSSEKRIQGRILAKSEGIWAGEGVAHAAQNLCKTLRLQSVLPDGSPFKPGDSVLVFTGTPSEILRIERPLLNISAYVSGIASTTRRCVDKVLKACPSLPPRVTLTRKTLPGYRDAAIHGVRTGGGHPHRVSLSGGVLIKENYITAAGGIASAIHSVRKVAPHGLKIEIEVETLEQLQEAIAAGAEGVLLDNFPVNRVQQAIQQMKSLLHRPLIEVSGGISEETISSYALEGVDVISLGFLTHSPKSVDLSLLLDRQ